MSARIGRKDRLNADLAPVAGRLGPDPGGDLAHLRLRLAPEGVDVGVLAGHAKGRLGRAAEVDRDARALHGPDLGRGALDPVERALVVHRRLGGPDGLQDGDVLVGAGVALVLAQPVAVARLVGVVAAGDDVDGGPPAGELVEGGEGTGGRGRALEARAVRDEEADALRVRPGMGRDLQPVGPVAEPADQDPVEAALVVRLGRGAQVAGVDRRAARRMDLRLRARLDHADELDVACLGHGGLLRSGGAVGGESIEQHAATHRRRRPVSPGGGRRGRAAIGPTGRAAGISRA